jgi:hypothetical protein
MFGLEVCDNPPEKKQDPHDDQPRQRDASQQREKNLVTALNSKSGTQNRQHVQTTGSSIFRHVIDRELETASKRSCHFEWNWVRKLTASKEGRS